VNVTVVNVATALGALGFLIGAVLQMRGHRVGVTSSGRS
jgi:hypothetical protein